MEGDGGKNAVECLLHATRRQGCRSTDFWGRYSQFNELRFQSPRIAKVGLAPAQLENPCRRQPGDRRMLVQDSEQPLDEVEAILAVYEMM